MKRIPSIILVSLVMISFSVSVIAQQSSTFTDSTFKGLKMRNIGPALMSGRIADIAIHPEDDNIWYVAVGSGGVWKTENAGTTWKPIFDDEHSYSIGCVTVDPNNPSVIWVGTGENVGGRHVGYGDGIYKSDDGGENWKNMGLHESQHISKIIVHPENSNILWVAAQGPLWSKGGERGLFKSVDRGKTWNKTLGDDTWTGVTDIVIDPRNPNRIYAATWQRHRNVASYMGGGPGSGIYRSEDGGDTWIELTEGLPKENMGKIGLAISPQKPDVLYAAIELYRREGGVYRSSDRGASWEKKSETVSGGTGPHYYMELYASPHQFDRIYLADVRMQISEDGGKTFREMKEINKHSDNHALAFRPDDPDYLLVGTDGGIYESFDLAQNWKYVANLPVTQFYKVAVDDAEPFYYVYGGTQDNNTQGGPSRTDNAHGIRNADWFVTLGGDGHQPATEPGNPDIIYCEWQMGNLNRIDRTTGEIVYIQPQPGPNDPPQRFNWDSPILVSPHDPKRLYFASQMLWRSNDRGDSWTAISGDLTRNQERIALPIMDKTWSWDANWDFFAMSYYNTITSVTESPLQDGLIYTGTDDGLIQVTEDGGRSWRKIEVSSLPGVPPTAFVNDIKADLFDVSTVYIVLDNHKYGDLQPYILKSTNKGKTWTSIRNNIPDRTLLWRVVQDHVKPGLLFLASEFGIYFTLDGGKKWIKITGDLPTIAFRDLAVQRRENDLVGASFGRGFFIFDDYSLLRDITPDKLNAEAAMFPVRDAWWYIERPVLGYDGSHYQGASYFQAPNPPFGATISYYLKEDYKSKKEIRQEKERTLEEKGEPITFPGWDEVEKERREDGAKLWIVVKNEQNEVVRRLEAPAKKGFHRIAWDLRYPDIKAIDTDNAKELGDKSGYLAAPGVYTASLYKEMKGEVTSLSGPVSFNVKRLYEGALKGSSPDEAVAFWNDIRQLQRDVSALDISIGELFDEIEAMQIAVARSLSSPGTLEKELYQLKQDVYEMDKKLSGQRSRESLGEIQHPSVKDRLNVLESGTRRSTYGPTPMLKESLDLARQQVADITAQLKEISGTRVPELKRALEKAGAPVVE